MQVPPNLIDALVLGIVVATGVLLYSLYRAVWKQPEPPEGLGGTKWEYRRDSLERVGWTKTVVVNVGIGVGSGVLLYVAYRLIVLM